MTTIPKNSRRAGELESELTTCRVYTLENQFLGRDVEPRYAWQALRSSRRAKLTDDGDGRFTVHVHDNRWYELRATAGAA